MFIIIGVLIVVVGGGVAAVSYLPDDAMLAVPLPPNTARRRLRPVGVVVILFGLAFPAVGYSLREPAPAAAVTVAATSTPTPAPTIPIIPTATPVPPSPTITPTRGTPAPQQFVYHTHKKAT